MSGDIDNGALHEAQGRDQAAAIAGLARVELALLAEDLGFRSDERISLLAIDGDEAVLVARYSDRPTFQQRGRGRYRLDQGIVREAYETGVGAVVDLPDPEADPAGWRRELRRRYRISAETANALTMRSRTVIALRIQHGSAGANALGFLVFESLRTADDAATGCILDPKSVQDLLAHHHAARFQGLLDVVCRLGVAG